MAEGFASVSTRAICAAAGVKQPTLYHFFGNKEELFMAVVQRWFGGLRTGIEGAIARGTTLHEQLHGIATVFWSGPVGEYQAMQRDAMTYMPDRHRAILGQTVWGTVIEPLMRVVRAAIDAEELPAYADPFVLTQLFWAMADGIGGIYQRGDPLPPPEANRFAIDFFLIGARGLSAEDYQAWPHQGNIHKLFRNEDAHGTS